jgi:Ca2+-binding RTX toxin-like protein
MKRFLKSLFARPKCETTSRKREAFRPRVECFEAREVPATLALIGGNLTYSAGANVVNNLAITRNSLNGSYTISDAEAININGNAAGTTGNGTTMVTIPGASITGQITVFLGNRDDVMRVNSTNRVVVGNLETGNDRFFVGTGAFSAMTTVRGGDGRDWIDYSGWSIGVRATVNGTGTRIAAMTGMENIRGGQGSDVLFGDHAGNVLVGLGGNDWLLGRGGADVLIGGANIDMIRGEAGSDLLIHGETSHVTNLVALDAIAQEWQRTDRTYGQRVAALRNGVGVNGTTRLTAQTVFADTGVDNLQGGTEADWFWAGVTAPFVDQLPDRNPLLEFRN